jgi:hypothetical protein
MPSCPPLCWCVVVLSSHIPCSCCCCCFCCCCCCCCCYSFCSCWSCCSCCSCCCSCVSALSLETLVPWLSPPSLVHHPCTGFLSVTCAGLPNGEARGTCSRGSLQFTPKGVCHHDPSTGHRGSGGQPCACPHDARGRAVQQSGPRCAPPPPPPVPPLTVQNRVASTSHL